MSASKQELDAAQYSLKIQSQNVKESERLSSKAQGVARSIILPSEAEDDTNTDLGESVGMESTHCSILTSAAERIACYKQVAHESLRKSSDLMQGQTSAEAASEKLLKLAEQKEQLTARNEQLGEAAPGTHCSVLKSAAERTACYKQLAQDSLQKSSDMMEGRQSRSESKSEVASKHIEKRAEQKERSMPSSRAEPQSEVASEKIEKLAEHKEHALEKERLAAKAKKQEEHKKLVLEKEKIAAKARKQKQKAENKKQQAAVKPKPSEKQPPQTAPKSQAAPKAQSPKTNHDSTTQTSAGGSNAKKEGGDVQKKPASTSSDTNGAAVQLTSTEAKGAAASYQKVKALLKADQQILSSEKKAAVKCC